MTSDQLKLELAHLEEQYEIKRQKLLDSVPAEVREAAGIAVKHIDKLDRTFEANGVKYIIHSSLSVKRYEEFEELQSRVGFGNTFLGMFTKFKDIFTHLNNSEPANASVIAHNAMTGIKYALDKQENAILLLCTLFINREGEDLKTWNEEEASLKIEDWRAEGIDIEDFFHIASTLIPGYIQSLKDITRGITGEAQGGKIKRANLRS